MKYFQNNLSGLYASLTLEHGGKGWDMSEEEGYGWGLVCGGGYRRPFVILHVTGAKRGMEIEQWKKC